MECKSHIRYVVVAAIALTSTLALSLPAAAARDYGVDLVVNYGMKLPNGKICRVVLGNTHMHSGNAADRNKERSKRKAIKAWRDYTVFEYGSKYGKWSKARKRSMRCSYDRDKRVWRCRADAQPCMR